LRPTGDGSLEHFLSPALAGRFVGIHISAFNEGTMKAEEERKGELARELKTQNERLITTAIESATGCRLENGVLDLEYPHPSINDFILKDSRRKLTSDALAKKIGIQVQVI